MNEAPDLSEDSMVEIEKHMRGLTSNHPTGQLSDETYADAMLVVNRALERRGAKFGKDERPEDARAVHDIADILSRLYQ